MGLFYKEERVKQKSKYNDVFLREVLPDPLKTILTGVSADARLNFSDFDHNVKCGFLPNKEGETRAVEKRWCRCLKWAGTENCTQCGLKSANGFNIQIRNAEVVDYEVPVSGKTTNIGEIDLIIKYQNEIFCTEVKPIWNDESLLRMFAEIITYCSVIDNNPTPFIQKYDNYKKAVLFVKYSEQYYQWIGEKPKKIRGKNEYKTEAYEYAACEELKKAFKEYDVTVFCLNNDGDKYKIEKLN